MPALPVGPRGSGPRDPILLADAIAPLSYVCADAYGLGAVAVAGDGSDGVQPQVQVEVFALDTLQAGEKYIGLEVFASGANAKVKLQGAFFRSPDGDDGADSVRWYDLASGDSTGSDAASELTLTAAAAPTRMFITPAQASGVRAAYRYYRLIAKNATAGSVAIVSAAGIVK